MTEQEETGLTTDVGEVPSGAEAVNRSLGLFRPGWGVGRAMLRPGWAPQRRAFRSSRQGERNASWE